MTVDHDELTKKVEAIGNLFEQFKTNHAKEIAEIKKSGHADSLTKEEGDKINKALGDLTAEKDKLVIRLKALAEGGQSDKTEAEHVTAARQAWGKFMRKGAHASSDGSFSFERKSDELEQKAMSVISDPDGGYTVTPDMNGRLVKKLFETSEIRSLASVQAIGSDALEGNYDLNEASSGWVQETGARPATNTPQIGKWRIPAHEQYAMPVATQKLLDDSNFNPEQWLADKLGDKFARAENNAFVLGTGVGQPRGFMTYGSGTTLPGTIEQKNSGTSAAFVADTLLEFVYLLKTGYRKNAQWGMTRTSLAAIRKIKDSQNRYLWEPGLNGKEQQNLLGYGINELSDMADPAASSLSAILADWKEFYQIVDRVGIRVLRDPYSSKGNVQFYSTKRVGGDVLNFEAAKIYKLAV